MHHGLLMQLARLPVQAAAARVMSSMHGSATACVHWVLMITTGTTANR
jgi:hypothetical protein